MGPSERAALIDAYIASCKWHWDKDKVFRKGEETDWATDRLFDLVSSDQELAWQVMRAIAKQDQSEEVLSRLANGHLLSLLKSYSDAVLPTIETDARAEPSVRELLSHVWDDNHLPDAVFQRVVASSEPGK